MLIWEDFLTPISSNYAKSPDQTVYERIKMFVEKYGIHFSWIGIPKYRITIYSVNSLFSFEHNLRHSGLLTIIMEGITDGKNCVGSKILKFI